MSIRRSTERSKMKGIVIACESGLPGMRSSVMHANALSLSSSFRESLTSVTSIVTNSDITSNGLNVQALMFEHEGDDMHDFYAKSTSGASGSGLGVAGSFALNYSHITTTATLGDDITAYLRVLSDE